MVHSTETFCSQGAKNRNVSQNVRDPCKHNYVQINVTDKTCFSYINKYSQPANFSFASFIVNFFSQLYAMLTKEKTNSVTDY